MMNKIQALEIMIDMITEAASDTSDLTAIMELLYEKADALDSKIIEIEENL